MAQISESDLPQEEKDVEIERLQQELHEAKEEIQSLLSEAQDAASWHENEISSLQERLCRVKADLQQAQRKLSEYDQEITCLRAEISGKELGTGDGQPCHDQTAVTNPDDQTACAAENVTSLQEELQSWRNKYQELREEYETLQESNKVAVHLLERQEAVKYRSRSKADDLPLSKSNSEESIECYFSFRKRASIQGGSSIIFKLPEVVGYGSSYDEDGQMSPLEEEDSESNLLWLLNMEERKEKAVQTQHNQAQDRLCQTEDPCPVSCEGWERLQEELRLCREEIKRINGTVPVGDRVPVGGMKVIALFAVLAGGMLLYHCLKRR